MRLTTLFMIPWKLRDLGRIRRITSVLARHGFSGVVTRLALVPWLQKLGRALFRREPDPARAVPVERRIRLAIEDLGPTFVKLGQMLASRPDLVPMSLIMELKHLQDEVPPFPVGQVHAIVEEELGRPVSEIFESFEEQPIAAASIAQVHRARLKTGEDVVVKVQRPRLDALIAADLRIITGLAKLLEDRVPEVRQFRPVAIIEEFHRSLNRETDFRAEANSMVRFAANFKDEPGLHVPRPFHEHSSRRVLVMERIEGVKVTDVEGLKRLGVDLSGIVDRGMRLTMRSIFDHGFFHADPHPGNFFIMSDGTIALLDFGMMGSIEPQRIDELLTFLVAILTGDLDMVMNLLLDADLIGDETDVRALRSDLRAILDRYKNVSIGAIDVSGFLAEVFEVVIRHHVVAPADLVLIAKSISTIEGIGREIFPQFNPLEAIRPYLTEVYVRRMMDTSRHTQKAVRSASDALALLKDAPFDLRRVLRKLRRGEIVLTVRSPEAEARNRLIANRTNRAILSALFPVFFFGSVFLLDSDSSLQNLAGLVSFGLAWVFFFGMVFSFFKGDGR